MTEHIQALIKKSAEATEPQDAVAYAHAASQCAAAVAAMANVGKHP